MIMSITYPAGSSKFGSDSLRRLVGVQVPDKVPHGRDFEIYVWDLAVASTVVTFAHLSFRPHMHETEAPTLQWSP